MSEQAKSTFHDERYAAVGDLVVRAALDAKAKLGALELDIYNSEIGGRADIKRLEERKILLEQDAAKLGAMAVQVDPKWAGDDNEEAATDSGTRILPLPSQNGKKEAAVLPLPEQNGNGSEPHPAYSIERLVFRKEENKAEFEERTAKFVRTMVARDNLIEQTDEASAGAILRDAMGLEQRVWSSYSTRLLRTGILIYERQPFAVKKVAKAYMNRERIEELINLGDLPADLSEELKKLDEPESNFNNSSEITRRLRGGLSSIHTRHTGAHTHGRVQAV